MTKEEVLKIEEEVIRAGREQKIRDFRYRLQELYLELERKKKSVDTILQTIEETKKEMLKI